MNDELGIEILVIIITSLSIIIGFILVFLQFIHERKEKILLLLENKLIALSLKEIDTIKIENAELKKKTSTKIIHEKKEVNKMINILVKEKLKLKIFRIKIPVIFSFYLLLTYYLIFFTISFRYIYLIAKEESTITIDNIRYLSFFTIIGYFLIIPLSYLSYARYTLPYNGLENYKTTQPTQNKQSKSDSQ